MTDKEKSDKQSEPKQSSDKALVSNNPPPPPPTTKPGYMLVREMQDRIPKPKKED